MYSTVASTPRPPKFDENLRLLAKGGARAFRRIDVDPTSTEYQVLLEEIRSAGQRNVVKIERIVNVDLWTEFDDERRKMLLKKTSDPALLRKLCPNGPQRLHRCVSLRR